MSPDAIHVWLHHPAVFVGAWSIALATPALGWILALAIVGPRHRAGRAAHAAGLGSAAVLLAALGLRAVGLLLGAGMTGATRWLDPIGAPAGGWHPVDAAVVLSFPLGLAMLIGVELAALWERGRPPRDLGVPYAGLIGALCFGAALIAVPLVWTTLQVLPSEPALLELGLALPVALVAFGIHSRASDRAPVAAIDEEEADDGALEHVDIVEHWRTVGAVGRDDRSFVKRDGGSDGPPTARSWAEAGGSGTAPELVDAHARRGIDPGHAWHVGDLPEPTQRAVCLAFAISALREHGRAVLIVGDALDPRDAQRLVSPEHAWPTGPVCVGLEALRLALAEERVPAIVHLTPAELSSGALRALGDGRTGSVWAREIGLLVLPRVDRGGPLALTHRLHVLRRLHLALARCGARHGVLTTGMGGRAAGSLVRQAFPGVAVKDERLRPASARALTVWLADRHFIARSPGGWVRQAAEPLARAGHPVRVVDPSGRFDEADLSRWSDRVSLDRDVALAGVASVGVLDTGWLIAAWRALPNAVRLAGEPGRHHALWSLVDEPLTRFLVSDGRLARLMASNELHAPEPLVAVENRPIARAHVAAALHEGEQELAALGRAFGLSVVQEALGEAPAPTRYATRRAADGQRIERTPRLSRRPEEPDDPVRPTVTTRVLQVVDSGSGRLLFAVDALTAPTRMYPRRVFAWGGHRYQVPLHAIDAKRDRVDVEAVDPDRPLTRPRLTVSPRPLRAIVALESTTRGRFTWRSGAWEVAVDEEVRGAASGPGALVEYAPVTATYVTRARALFVDAATRPDALAHLAGVLSDVLRALWLSEPDDLAVIALPEGWAGVAAPAILVLDRQIQGLGGAEALDETLCVRAFDWCHALLAACDCARGCGKCTPAATLEAGALDRHGVIALLKGERAR